jgi:hypothetical protein
MHRPIYLHRLHAARHVRETWGLPCSPKWLAKLAVIGGGPIYRKAGRTPLYTPDDLDVWANDRIGVRRHSTSVLVDDGSETSHRRVRRASVLEGVK